jgi:hypothetical protein
MRGISPGVQGFAVAQLLVADLGLLVAGTLAFGVFVEQRQAQCHFLPSRR